MTVKPYDIDPARFLEDHLAQASPELLRQMLTTFINALMSADADAVCGAGYGKVSEERTHRRRRVPSPPVRYPRRQPADRYPQTAGRIIFSRLVAGAAPEGRAGSNVGGGYLLPGKESPLGGWTPWSKRWGSRGCRSH